MKSGKYKQSVNVEDKRGGQSYADAALNYLKTGVNLTVSGAQNIYNEVTGYKDSPEVVAAQAQLEASKLLKKKDVFLSGEHNTSAQRVNRSKKGNKQ